MGRPKKDGIDYFPHMVKGGKTLFILENDHGNDGYAFWFKLLEILGDTKGHYYDCNDISNWKYLISKTKLSEISVTEILQILADLDAIDRELWQYRVIWSQNFVDGIADVYKKRGTEIPRKPDFCHRNSTITDISDTESTHSKVNKSKVNNITTTTKNKEEDPEPEIQVDGVDEILKFYCEQVGKLEIHCTAADTQVALNWINNQISMDIIKKAITEKSAYAKKQNKQINSLSYFEGKVKDFINEKNNPPKKSGQANKKSAFDNFEGRKYNAMTLEEQLLAKSKGELLED